MSGLPAALAAQLPDLTADARPVVLIDGRAGAGKTTVATWLRDAWPGSTPELVGMDEFYPGWDGLASAACGLPRLIREDGFITWDWMQHRPGAWRSLDPQRPLIVEGCGALTPASKALATFSLWLEVAADVRRERALARDGDLFAPHWERWAAQEDAHWYRHHPQQLADLVVDGADLG